MGYEYLTPSETLSLRGSSNAKVLLETVLKEHLKKINSFSFKGKEYKFSDENIQKAVNELVSFRSDGLIKDNERVYDLLTLGKNLEQTINGYTKSFTLKYIDWINSSNNVYHVTDEFEVARVKSTHTRRPDIVIFVNGIPLVVIECKRHDIRKPLSEAISQHLRNQRGDEVPHLFVFSQILMVVCQNDAKYATCGTVEKFWSVWKEELSPSNEEYFKEQLFRLINSPLTDSVKNKTVESYQGNKDEVLRYFNNIERTPSLQDKALYSLLSPSRLLTLTYQYIVFDNNIKKIARYQQYFAIEETIKRISAVKGDSKRSGGVIWHTTGSGKSLTMVMLAKALILKKDIINTKVILVTDRVDLDDQIWSTFYACGVDVVRARTGKHLIELISKDKATVITTVIDKFESATNKKTVKDESCNIFVLIDESHRSQYGTANARMRVVFPNACYIGFTGTPLLKEEKNTARQFGGFIHKYSMDRAVKDKAVVPLLYEGRMSELSGDSAAIDKWFDRITKDLNDKQKADLKKKFQREDEFAKSEERMAEIAYDISCHFKDNFKNTGFKGQFACSGKKVAMAYKKLFDEYCLISTEIIISPPDSRKDNKSISEEDIPEIVNFWNRMMKKYGNEKKYNKDITNAFKSSGDPEVLIVVDKLLTWFDAPKNIVLYIDKKLKDHNILQAIARVNRLYEGKDFGFIVDYRGIFGALNEMKNAYSELEKFDAEDLTGSYHDIEEEISKLQERHTNLWAVFKSIKNKSDIEEMQQFLAPEDIRQDFYDNLNMFAKTLKIAFSNSNFWDNTKQQRVIRYKTDLKYFLNLRVTVKQRYSDSIDYSEYETQIANMIHKHIGADKVKTIVEQVSIFELEDFERELEQVDGDAAKAELIASRTKKTCIEKTEEDPVFYKRLSDLIEEAINNYRAHRISEKEYLDQVTKHMNSATGQNKRTLPKKLYGNNDASAYYGTVAVTLGEYSSENQELSDILAELAIQVEKIITENKIRDWQYNNDIQNTMLNDIEDLLFEYKDKHNIELSTEDMDTIMNSILTIAKRLDM